MKWLSFTPATPDNLDYNPKKMMSERPPLEESPDEIMTITYLLAGVPTVKEIKGKEMYYGSNGFYDGPTNTYVPGHLTNIFGNRNQYNPLFTVATNSIVTIEVTKV